MRKADRHKTAFACELGLFEWQRMPFGLCNASATFQRAIARALRKFINRKGSMVMVYIDDIMIATETVEDHMARLREVFECLREAGFKMRIAKCDFMKSEIKYLGRVVSAEGVKPDPKSAMVGSREEAGRKRMTGEDAANAHTGSVTESPTSRPPPDKRADVPRPQMKSVVIATPLYRVGHLSRGAPQMTMEDAIERYGTPEAGSEVSSVPSGTTPTDMSLEAPGQDDDVRTHVDGAARRN